MNVAIKKRFDLPDNLFEEDDVQKSKDTFSDEESPSEEMTAIVDKIEKRLKNRKKGHSIAASTFDRTCLETKKMMESGDWEGVQARHLVAIYDIMHTQCYGVEDTTLDSKARYKAITVANSFTRREFGGNFEEAVEYLHWRWQKEIRLEKWRRENGKIDSWRLSWNYLFSRRCLMDYKLYLARTT